MSTNKCPFSAIQAAGAAACTLAQEVVRRGGSEYDCTDADAHAACTALSAHLIRTGFDSLDLVDDLNVTPKSAYDRAQIGGLQGLGSLLPGHTAETALADIGSLVGAVGEGYAQLADIPSAALVEAINSYRPARRRGARRR